MSKKILAILLTMTMVMSLAACSSSEEKETNEVIEEDDEVEEEIQRGDEESEETVSDVEEEKDDNVNTEEQASEVDETKDDDVLSGIEEYRYLETDDGIACWDVYFKEGVNTDFYDEVEFGEIIKECLKNDENKADDVTNFGIQGFDSEGQLIFSWLSYQDKYTVTQYIWSKTETNPRTYDWKFSQDEINDIYSALDE